MPSSRASPDVPAARHRWFRVSAEIPEAGSDLESSYSTTKALSGIVPTVVEAHRARASRSRGSARASRPKTLLGVPVEGIAIGVGSENSAPRRQVAVVGDVDVVVALAENGNENGHRQVPHGLVAEQRGCSTCIDPVERDRRQPWPKSLDLADRVTSGEAGKGEVHLRFLVARAAAARDTEGVTHRSAAARVVTVSIGRRRGHGGARARTSLPRSATRPPRRSLRAGESRRGSGCEEEVLSRREIRLIYHPVARADW